MLTVLAFLIVLGVLIFVHELGHFVAAKAVGIGVPRFSIGFGPPTPLRFRRGETEYVVSWLPLGGYVKMASREEQEAMGALEGGKVDEHYPPERLFENQSLPARVLVLSAGVAMNAVFAWLVYTGLALATGEQRSPTTVVAWVDTTALPSGARGLAAVPPEARVIRINGDTVTSWTAIRRHVLDPSSEWLRFEFANAAPVVVPVRGTATEARSAMASALKPAWTPRIGARQPGSPAERAGLEPGDVVVRVGDDTVRYWDDIARLVGPRAGDTLAVTLRRGDSTLQVVVVPELQTDRDPLTGMERTAAKLGVYPDVETVQVRYGVTEALAVGTRRTVDAIGLVFFTLRKMIVREISVRELGGPILIGQVSGQAARAGLEPFLVIMAFISINLAVLNLLPIPVLDGGHLVFLLIEGLRGRPLSLELRMRLTQVGMVVLLVLMVFVVANDVVRVFGG